MRRLLPALLLAAACSGEPLPPPAPAKAAATPVWPATPPAPGLRLPSTAAPVRYEATLALVPAAQGFDGAVRIDLLLAEPTAFLWLNATDITVVDARLEVAGREIAVHAVPGGEDHVGFAFAETVPAGSAKLSVTYRGTISDKDDRGVFREEEDGEKYLFSQFENIEARRAFPCFDEPAFKVPWQLTLRVPEGDTALSNTPAISETRIGGGSKEIRFAETKPLPSYLVAFAVGPFDVVDAGRVGAGKTKLRIAAPRGRGERARHAVKATPELLERLEAYFGMPYPYEKLDVVAIPQLLSFGAMENAGLITCAESLLLARPEDETLAWQRSFAAVIAHEMGHQWFGDLVTMRFWDDIWLNEAFASWLEDKALSPWRPEWQWEIARARATTRAMEGDSLVSARRVRQAIETKDDIQNAFDEITYDKGAAVISMFEAYAGPSSFRRGVARYLRDHAHGSASSADFLGAIEAEAGADIGPAFSTFLDQPGVPLVRGAVRCDRGQARIALSQQRYLPLGSPGSRDQVWRVPVCARWAGKKGEGRTCTMLHEREATLELPAAAGCPRWVMLDADDAGYYHAGLDGPSLTALLKEGWPRLSPGERVAVVRDLAALVASGDLPVGEVLARVPDLLRDPSPEVLEGAIGLLSAIRPAMVPPELRPKLARWVQRTFGARARAIGWLPKPGEDDRIRLIRPMVMLTVADRGDDKALLAEADTLARRWLDDPSVVPADLVGPVLFTAASRGDARLFERLRGALRTAKDERRHRRILRALAAFRDPAVVRTSLGLYLGDEIDRRLAAELLFQDEEAAPLVLDFLKTHYDAIVERAPGELRGALPSLAEPFCDEGRRAEVEAFFADRVKKLTGGPRTLAKTLERIGLCAARRKAMAPSLRGFLR